LPIVGRNIGAMGRINSIRFASGRRKIFKL
jgi:hypothetical protein